MPPDLALLPASSKSGIVVEEGNGGSPKRNVMALVSTARVDGRQIPEGDGELCIGRQTAVVNGQRQPLVPDATVAKVLVGRLGGDGQRLGVGKRRDGDVELGVGGEVAAAVAQIGSLEQRRVGQRLLVPFQPVSARSIN